jgi:hypothetical protein
MQFGDSVGAKKKDTLTDKQIRFKKITRKT